MSFSPARRYARLIVVLLAVPLALAVGQAAFAHPADEILERDLVHVRPDAIQFDLTISAGAITMLTVWKAADTNGDGVLDARERDAFGQSLAGGIATTVDNKTAPVQYVADSLMMPQTVRAFSLQSADASGATVSATFSIPFNASIPHEIAFSVTHFRAADGAKPPDLLPDADAPLGIIIQGGSDVALRMTVASHMTLAPSLAAGPSRPPNDRNVTLLQRYVRERPGSPLFIVLGLIVAAVLGALHALTPGHGKTLITAYLVGTGGRPRDALALGGIITATHTGSVIVLGVVTLLVARFWTPYRVLPWIEGATSVAIIAVGLWLAWTRFATVNAIAGRHSGASARTATALNESPPIDVTREHEHEDGTVHTHGWRGAHSHTPLHSGNRSLRAIALVGVSGGILPCPDALAILLIAVAAGNILSGLLIVVAFSTGLAIILIGLGLLITSTQVIGRVSDRAIGGRAIARWIPTCSAVIMVAVGVAALGRVLAAIM